MENFVRYIEKTYKTQALQNISLCWNLLWLFSRKSMIINVTDKFAGTSETEFCKLSVAKRRYAVKNVTDVQTHEWCGIFFCKNIRVHNRLPRFAARFASFTIVYREKEPTCAKPPVWRSQRALLVQLACYPLCSGESHSSPFPHPWFLKYTLVSLRAGLESRLRLRLDVKGSAAIRYELWLVNTLLAPLE